MKKGYILTSGNNIFFLESKNINKTKNNAVSFITAIGQKNNICGDLIERCKQDVDTINKIKTMMTPAAIEMLENETTKFYRITGKNILLNIPEIESDCIIYV